MKKFKTTLLLSMILCVTQALGVKLADTRMIDLAKGSSLNVSSEDASALRATLGVGSRPINVSEITAIRKSIKAGKTVYIPEAQASGLREDGILLGQLISNDDVARVFVRLPTTPNSDGVWIARGGADKIVRIGKDPRRAEIWTIKALENVGSSPAGQYITRVAMPRGDALAAQLSDAEVPTVGSTRNGHDSAGRRLGVKKFGGEAVIPGNIIIRQRGTEYYPDDNMDTVPDHMNTYEAIRLADGQKSPRREMSTEKYVSWDVPPGTALKAVAGGLLWQNDFVGETETNLQDDGVPPKRQLIARLNGEGFETLASKKPIAAWVKGELKANYGYEHVLPQLVLDAIEKID